MNNKGGNVKNDTSAFFHGFNQNLSTNLSDSYPFGFHQKLTVMQTFRATSQEIVETACVGLLACIKAQSLDCVFTNRLSIGTVNYTRNRAEIAFQMLKFHWSALFSVIHLLSSLADKA